MSQRALCYLVHDLPSSNNAFQNKCIWIYYRQREQITAVCLVFLSWSTSNLTCKILQSVCYLLNLEVSPSINTFCFWLWNCSLNVALACPRRANEELSVSRWIRRGLAHCRCLCVYVDLCMYCIRISTLRQRPCFCMKFHHTVCTQNPSDSRKRLRSLREAVRCVPSDLWFCQ